MKKVTKSVKTLEQARKVLGLPYLNDKVICFISSWERTKITPFMPAEDDEKEYAFQELALFELAKNLWQKDGDFSFYAFREFEDVEENKLDLEGLANDREKFEKEFFVFSMCDYSTT